MFPSKVVCEIASQPFKRAQTGLFHGKTKLSGNNVPFSKHKTRRTWLPNVQYKHLRSEVLDENIRIKLTTRALKTIKKVGGLDNYLKNTSGDLLGEKGMELRMKIRAAQGKLDLIKGIKKPSTDRLGAIKNAFTLPSKKIETIAPNKWTARSARLVAGWSLGLNRLATAYETIAFYEKVKEKAAKKAPGKVIFKALTPKFLLAPKNIPYTPTVKRIPPPSSTTPLPQVQEPQQTGVALA